MFPHISCSGKGMKAYKGSRGKAPAILNLGVKQVWVVSIMPWPLYHRGMRLHYLFKRVNGWAPDSVWIFWRTEKSLACAGNVFSHT